MALLVSAQLSPVVDEVLKRTRGNLYVANELSRLGELSSNTQIRMASNAAKMSEFARGWSDEHDLSEPLTGAVFDLLVDMYQWELVERGLIPSSLDQMVREVRLTCGPSRRLMQAEYDRWYPRAPGGFRRALAAACDRLRRSWRYVLTHLRADRISYVVVQMALQRADTALGGGRFAARHRRQFCVARDRPGRRRPLSGHSRHGPQRLATGRSSLREALAVVARGHWVAIADS